jgi:hypothetical protein
MLGLALSTSAAAQVIPPRSPKPFPNGGSYGGPGDTVPPPCTGPGCPPPPPPPPPTICWMGPCTNDYGNDLGCYGPCFMSPQPLPGVNNINWLDVNGNPVAPPCMQGAGVYRVYHITIQNLIDAGNAAGFPWAPRSNLCFFDTCPFGVEAVFIYTTLPFQYHPEGIQTSTGGYLQACGMGYDFKIAYDNGSCSDLGYPNSQLVNSEYVGLGCTTDITNMTLQYDVACLQNLLTFYGALGLYNPWPGAGTWLTSTSVAFVVAVKCCPPSGDPTCQ